MDKWIKYRKGHANIAYTPDIIIASILRLIGELSVLWNVSLLLIMSWWENKSVIIDANQTLTVMMDFYHRHSGCILTAFSSLTLFLYKLMFSLTLSEMRSSCGPSYVWSNVCCSGPSVHMHTCAPAPRIVVCDARVSFGVYNLLSPPHVPRSSLLAQSWSRHAAPWLGTSFVFLKPIYRNENPCLNRF